MNPADLRHLLEQLATGGSTVNEVLRRLEMLPFESLGFACLDHHRALRCGFPEVIFGQGKAPEQVETIFLKLAATRGDVLATRVEPAAAERVRARCPAAAYHELARTLTLRQTDGPPGPGLVGIVCAGSSDLPVAEEARITAEIMGQRTVSLYDVGVAGLHRLLARTEDLRAASVLVVVAGMEGALPSVVGGLVKSPVIAVPTSVGYGASFHGLAALLTMLNSCAAGVSVVNIDNGFGAGYQAALINRTAAALSGTAEAGPAKAGTAEAAVPHSVASPPRGAVASPPRGAVASPPRGRRSPGDGRPARQPKSRRSTR
jgi:pyridinium-3,5-biscarboxylic acid mononucleotide synthase